MKKILFRISIVIAAISILTGCKKEEEEVQIGAQHFNFKANGTAYNFSSDVPQYISDNPNQVGGFQMNNNTTVPNISLSFMFLNNPSDAEVLALAGRTFYFDGSYPKPVITFDGGAESGAEKYKSHDTLSAVYQVKVSGVTFIKDDETVYNNVGVYRITGTCKAYMQNNMDTTIHMDITDGDFSFAVSKVK